MYEESQQTSHLKSRLHLTLPKLWPSVVFFKCSESHTHSPNVPPLKSTRLSLDGKTRVRFVVYCIHYSRTRKGFSFESILVLHKFKLKKPGMLTLSLPSQRNWFWTQHSAWHHAWCIAGPQQALVEEMKWLKDSFWTYCVSFCSASQREFHWCC